MSERTAIRIGVPLAVGGWIVAAVLLWRTSVPSLHLTGFDPHSAFSDDLLRRAHRYGNGERLIWLLGRLAAIAALVVLVRRLPRSARGLGLGRVSGAIVIGMVVLVTLWFVSLPFSVANLWWQHHYDLGPFDVGGWLAAQYAALPARAVFTLAEIAIAVALAVRFPRGWWVPGTAAFVALVALFAFLSGWIASAGAKPIRDPGLRADVTRLRDVEGVHPPVRILKVSDWTQLPNAFTVGYGPSTRVVVWDTLLDGRFTRKQIDVVVAHELGHARSDHIPKSVGWYALLALPEAFLVAFVTGRRGGLRNPANIPLAALVLAVFAIAVAPLQNAISRRYEAEADWRALVATKDPAAARGLFRRFVPTTLEEPDPPLWDYAFLENHPTIAQRLAMVDAYAARGGRR
jgi:STE24 endopeptidase